MPGAQFSHVVSGKVILAVALPSNPSISGATALTAVSGFSGANANLVCLGYSLEGVTVAFEQGLHEIHGDQNGGPEGWPVDVMGLGLKATITADVIDYTELVYEALVAHKGGGSGSAGTFGVPEVAGTLLLAGSKTIRLVLASAAYPLNFPTTYFRDKVEGKNSALETVQKFTFEAITPSFGGTLFNRILT